jgi:hypothetical protein
LQATDCRPKTRRGLGANSGLDNRRAREWTQDRLLQERTPGPAVISAINQGYPVVDTSIEEEIAALREQIAAAEEAIGRRRAPAAPLAPGDAPAATDADLDAAEALRSMSARLSRLLSCKRTPN